MFLDTLLDNRRLFVDAFLTTISLTLVSGVTAVRTLID